MACGRIAYAADEFKLNFAIFDNKDIGAFSDKNSILVLDKRSGQNKSYALKKGLEPITKLYTDGSFLEKKTGAA